MPPAKAGEARPHRLSSLRSTLGEVYAESAASREKQEEDIKERYAEEPEAAVVTLKASGSLGDGSLLCSGDMLLEALVACAGVTLRAVSTSLGVQVEGGSVRAEGELDFRGTLAVDRDAPVGFRAIRLDFDLDAEASEEELETLLKLTERYCVVFQTLSAPPQLSASVATSPARG